MTHVCVSSVCTCVCVCACGHVVMSRGGGGGVVVVVVGALYQHVRLNCVHQCRLQMLSLYIISNP